MCRAFTALAAGALALMLAACGSDETAALDALRSELEGAGSVSVSAEVSSNTGGRLAEYTLRCTRSDGEVTVEVLAPESLAGVSVSGGTGSGELRYGSLMLEVPLEGVSPLTALPLTLAAIEDGYAALSWSEGDETLFSLELSDASSVTLTLSAEGTPVRSELIDGGESAAVCEIGEFTINEAME